ncbi:DinB family protein [Euzebyella saccharophila]|uniref:DinB family protein n=1 Tax=Euzebyella saccharophila TaxID=679664 RepID=A0ABV8JRW5_9FLAO|nr:DinB family protein [Euzebyella saccharophila]
MKPSELQFSEPYPFYKKYIDTLKDEELLETMKNQLQNFPQFINSIPEEKMGFRYGPDKWIIAEVLLHIIDSERVFQYRALRFSRGDQTPLPGFEQDDYVPFSNAVSRNKQSIIEEYTTVRKATITLFSHLDEETLLRTGTASSLPWSVASVGFAICGHQRHHRNILRERYL